MPDAYDLTTSLGTCVAALQDICSELSMSPDRDRVGAASVQVKCIGMAIQIHDKIEERRCALLMHEELKANRDERNANATAGVVRSSKAHPDLGPGSSDGDEA